MDEAARSSQEKQPDAVTNPCAEPRPKQERQAAPAATPRKRQIDDSDVEPQPKRARLTRKKLTRKNLAEFNKMGKKKASDPTDDSGSTKTKSTSTTSTGFADKARKNGILPPRSSKPPTNLDEIHRRHAKSRETASPPESAYNDYADRVEGAENEATLVVEVSGELLKKYPKGYKRAFNKAFTNLPKDAGFNNGLSAPQPDFVEGLEKEEYRPFPVDEYLDSAALHSDNPYSVTLPQIAGEWKGPDGSMKEAELQSSYDGAALVHARAQALAYMGKEDPPGHAEITTFTTDGTNLNLYAHYATPADATPAEDDEDALEYHQYLISSANLTGTYQGHKDGRKSLRNAQDHAKTQSEQLRDQLKQHWKKNRNQPDSRHHARNNAGADNIDARTGIQLRPDPNVPASLPNPSPQVTQDASTTVSQPAPVPDPPPSARIAPAKAPRIRIELTTCWRRAMLVDGSRSSP
ncbi:hypothetical protein B0T16DRAFT_10295 [Cercophora newfieldiana]|uniref:Uncharacterized protein n=1 Tax=Cercophora newfieldiana TaxID=92897 RepID=A0AA40CXP5_9PEZI|nr:hypothetical protein B0T16DRAFT_10295 [Cercophora newfieldiana]